MAETWSLFVDESGRFDRQDLSMVVGVLAKAPGRGLGGQALRRELQRIWGPGPWPPHAATVRIPASHAVYAAARRFPDGLKQGAYAKPDSVEVKALIQHLEDSSFASLLDRIRRGAFPKDEHIRDAQRLLHGPAVRPALKRVRGIIDDQSQAMNALVARVFAKLELQRVMVPITLADALPEGPQPPDARVQEDPYTRALTVLLERVARLAGDVEIQCWILTRDVEVGGLGSAPLQAQLLRPIFDDVLDRTGSACRFVPMCAVTRYGDWPRRDYVMHPMLVLADWLANRSRRAIGRRAVGLPALRSHLVGCGLVPDEAVLEHVPAVAPGLAPLPVLAAAGGPEARVRAAFAGEEPPPPVGKAPPWAWEQATLWERAAGVWP
jgi:hypothetical protein